nr:zinc finger CCCH domain-containing protein 25-like [Tanacetum cinerariifolium]
EYFSRNQEFEMFKRGADLFVCAIMPNNGSKHIKTTHDNLNGAQVLGGTIRVDHVAKYKKKEEGDEEEDERKREECRVCHASQI